MVLLQERKVCCILFYFRVIFYNYDSNFFLIDCKGGERKTTMSRIYDICKTYSLVTDACAEAGAFLTSKFLTR